VSGWPCGGVEGVGELAGADEGFRDGLRLMSAEDSGVAAWTGEYGVEAEGESNEEDQERCEKEVVSAVIYFIRMQGYVLFSIHLFSSALTGMMFFAARHLGLKTESMPFWD
jgi:hypothetical protein